MSGRLPVPGNMAADSYAHVSAWLPGFEDEALAWKERGADIDDNTILRHRGRSSL